MYILQATAYAYSPHDNVPGDAWEDMSKHKTISAAVSAYDKERADMRERTGGTGWDGHYRIVEATRQGRTVLIRDPAERWFRPTADEPRNGNFYQPDELELVYNPDTV